jgi:hypothetical protein
VIEYNDGKAYFWACRDDCATRMEIQTGISDGRWIEVLKRRPMGKADAPWVPIDGSVPVIVTDDASGLSEGAAVHAEPQSAQAAAPVAADSR